MNAALAAEALHRVLTTFRGFTYNMNVRFRYLLLAILCLFLTGAAAAQDTPPHDTSPQDASPRDTQPVERVPVDKSAPAPKDNRANPPRTDNVSSGESSSKQTQIDVSAPANDEKAHPEAALSDTGVDEF